MAKHTKLIGIRELLEGVAIAKVDLSPSGGSYRLWRKKKRPKGDDADGLMLVCEIHTNHIFDHLGRYVANDIEFGETLTPDIEGPNE